MTLVYVLVTCLPVLFIILAFTAIAVAGFRTGIAGRRVYLEIKPEILNLKQQAAAAQEKALTSTRRVKTVSDTFEELTGRWAFITQTFRESSRSPVIRLAGAAGRRARSRTRKREAKRSPLPRS